MQVKNCATCGTPTPWEELVWHDGHEHCRSCTHWRWVDEHDALHTADQEEK